MERAICHVLDSNWFVPCRRRASRFECGLFLVSPSAFYRGLEETNLKNRDLVEKDPWWLQGPSNFFFILTQTKTFQLLGQPCSSLKYALKQSSLIPKSRALCIIPAFFHHGIFHQRKGKNIMEDILKRGFAQPNILPETNPMLISNFESNKISYRGRILQYHIWAGCMSDLYDEMTHILGVIPHRY